MCVFVLLGAFDVEALLTHIRGGSGGRGRPVIRRFPVRFPSSIPSPSGGVLISTVVS